jgi:hypothetical protein
MLNLGYIKLNVKFRSYKNKYESQISWNAQCSVEKIIYVIQLSDRVYNVTFPAYDIYSLRCSRREYIS